MRSRGSIEKYKYSKIDNHVSTVSNTGTTHYESSNSPNSVTIDIESNTPISSSVIGKAGKEGKETLIECLEWVYDDVEAKDDNEEIKNDDEEIKDDEKSLNELLFRSNSIIHELFELRREGGGELIDRYIDFSKLNILLNDVLLKKVKARHLFIEYLDSEWNKYQHFTEEKALKISKYAADKCAMMDILKFNEFMWINQQCLSDLISKYDAISESKLAVIWEWKLNWKPQKILFKLIKEISNLYYDCDRDIENGGNGINNYSFDRKCTKMWVSHENVFQVIGIIIQHLPIYVYGQKRDSPQVYQRISSVYFDNDEFKCYHERVGKEEGARAVRVRWYDEYQPINGADKVFMERKIHHCSSITDEPSLKERFKIKNNQIIPFIKGVYDYKDSNNELKNEIYDFIREYKLKPQTRTVCKRISFQFNNSNALRISLDLNLTFVRENNNLLNENKWFTPKERILDDDVVRFPFDILEIKLSGKYVDDPPQWIMDLMESDLLIECFKFSKYGQSVNAFYSNNIHLIPKWIQENEQILLKQSDNNNKIVLDNNKYKLHCLSLPSSEQNKKDNKKKKNKISKKPVNPKIYFSNERTFLGWFQAAVFIGGSGLTIHSIDHKDVAGYLLLCVAVLVLLWAIMLYYKRNFKLLKGKLTGLHDFYGPTILVTVILFVFAYSLFNGNSEI